MDFTVYNCVLEVAAQCVEAITSSSSCSSSDSELENDLLRAKKAKIDNFAEDIVPKYTDDLFQDHFRLSRTCIQELIEKYSESWYSGRSRRPKTDFKKSILITLWTLANQESFCSIADRFGLSISTTQGCFYWVCELLYIKRKDYIVWPRGEEIDRTISDFNNLRRKSFPNVVGCIDGTHIQIIRPSGDNSFYNRKGYHSFVIQAVCNSNLKFTNLYVGWPGSAHDARVWRSSQLYDLLKNNGLKEHHHILGDSAYPLDTFLMKPYKDNGHLNVKQLYFNQVLSSTRIVIEQAFGRLKGMFRRLKYLHCFRLERFKQISTAACIFHNIAIENNGGNFEDSNETTTKTRYDMNDEDEESSLDAIIKRNEIADFLYQRDHHGALM